MIPINLSGKTAMITGAAAWLTRAGAKMPPFPCRDLASYVNRPDN